MIFTETQRETHGESQSESHGEAGAAAPDGRRTLPPCRTSASFRVGAAHSAGRRCPFLFKTSASSPCNVVPLPRNYAQSSVLLSDVGVRTWFWHLFRLRVAVGPGYAGFGRCNFNAWRRITAKRVPHVSEIDPAKPRHLPHVSEMHAKSEERKTEQPSEPQADLPGTVTCAPHPVRNSPQSPSTMRIGRYPACLWQIPQSRNRYFACLWHRKPDMPGTGVGIPTLIPGISANRCHKQAT